MRNMCPCYKCESGGQYHTRCKEYGEWDAKEKEHKEMISIERNKYRDADAFTNTVINKTRRKGKI